MAKNKKCKPGDEFVFANGARASTLTEFKKELRKLSEAEFAHHVSEYKNDFANWLRDCINPELAQKIEGVKDKDSVLKSLS